MTTCWNCNKEIAEGASSCPHCRVPVTKAAVDAMATIGPGGAPSVQIVPGSVVSGRYEVRREIGRGGMGIVYLAYDRTMELEVALKVIPQELCMDPRAIADLKRETGIALKLTHPHIMRLHTLDTWEGQAYVVMEYVGGGTLAHLLAEKQRLSLDEALPLLEQIAAALDYSHTASPAVIHRDLKPLNILLTDQEQVKVADFGLARVLRDSASRISGHDSAGTLAYMAPEQIRGKGIGRHTDIYALAVISYEMLAGHPPFHTGDLRWQIINEEPDSISGQPEQVNQVLLEGLTKEVEGRPVSAGSFVHLLSCLPEEEIVVAPLKPESVEEAEVSPQVEAEPEEPGSIPDKPERLDDQRKRNESSSKTPMFIALITLAIAVLGAGVMAGGFDFLLRGEKVKQSEKVEKAGQVNQQAAGQERELGGLIATSTPPGAKVYLNDRYYGLTPLVRRDLEAGSYTVMFTKDLYETSEKQIIIKGDSLLTISSGVLQKRAKSTVSLESEDKKAQAKNSEAQKLKERAEKAQEAARKAKARLLRDKNSKNITNDIGMRFVFIGPGTFMMGSPPDEPERNFNEKLHRVTITHGYYLQTTEVTQKQWQQVMGNNPSSFSQCGANCPVENVSWADAKRFIVQLNRRTDKFTYRLPTEAEWEYAARAETTTPFAFGRCLSTEQANCDGGHPLPGCPKGEEGKSTMPVASFMPNAWGLYDMHGNVREWCQDWRGNYPSAAIDPTGPSSGAVKVIRGGSFFGGGTASCRSARRLGYDPDRRSLDYGFRLVLSSEDETKAPDKISQARSILTDYPKKASYYLDQADKYHDKGKIYKAHEFYLKALPYSYTKREKIRAYSSLVVTFFELKKYSEALTYCEKVLEIAPKSKWALGQLDKISELMAPADQNEDVKTVEGKRKTTLLLQSLKLDGEYRRYDGEKIDPHTGVLEIKSVGVNQYSMKGEAYWIGNVEEGDIRVAHSNGVISFENGKAYYGDQYRCSFEISISQDNQLIIDNDTGHCGGLSVSFNGVYRRHKTTDE